MSNAAYLPSREVRFNTSRRSNKWKIIIGVVVALIAIVIASLYFYQSTRFNSQITINGIKVGGLTAEKALNKLQATVLNNEVYLGTEKIIDGQDTKAGFTKEDIPGIKKLIEDQKTFFPSSKVKNYSFAPIKLDRYHSDTLKKLIVDHIITKNNRIKATLAAGIRIENGQLIAPGANHEMEIDIEKTMNDYQKLAFTGKIHLNPVYIQPTAANNQIEKNKENMLRDLIGRTINYKVQDKVYSLKASDVIKKATVSNDLQYIIDTTDIKKKIEEINQTQSTLKKDFDFKSNSGSMLKVKGETYGWAINVDKETKLIEEAFVKGDQLINAKNIYGTGWTTYGTGFNVTTNNGIGDTYVEVSIKDQQIWVYKNGKLILNTNVVTGWKGVNNQDTPTGVWYIQYKKTHAILRGSSFTHKNYESKVNYWAPFTLMGHGLHDADWRTDWSNDAYLTDGSNGCVNILPSVMKQVFDNLEPNEPVVIY